MARERNQLQARKKNIGRDINDIVYQLQTDGSRDDRRGSDQKKKQKRQNKSQRPAMEISSMMK